MSEVEPVLYNKREAASYLHTSERHLSTVIKNAPLAAIGTPHAWTRELPARGHGIPHPVAGSVSLIQGLHPPSARRILESDRLAGRLDDVGVVE